MSKNKVKKAEARYLNAIKKCLKGRRGDSNGGPIENKIMLDGANVALVGLMTMLLKGQGVKSENHTEYVSEVVDGAIFGIIAKVSEDWDSEQEDYTAL